MPLTYFQKWSKQTMHKNDKHIQSHKSEIKIILTVQR